VTTLTEEVDSEWKKNRLKPAGQLTIAGSSSSRLMLLATWSFMD